MEKGIESLRAAFQQLATEGNNCFNENGCDKVRTKMVPEDNPVLLEMGITEACKQQTKCTHDYCGKYAWVLQRAQQYADFLGKTRDEVIAAWEEKRTYGALNYYQNCNQPEIGKAEGLVILKYDDWVNSLKDRFGEDSKQWKFKCPNCGGTQSIQDFLDNGVKDPDRQVYFNCIGRFVADIGCDWSLGGLFKLHKTVVIQDMQIIPVFEMAEK